MGKEHNTQHYANLMSKINKLEAICEKLKFCAKTRNSLEIIENAENMVDILVQISEKENSILTPMDWILKAKNELIKMQINGKPRDKC